ncbi:MAG: glycoside hydrolase family 28 protein [Candidatus Sulfotelmatobacter sp.]
MSNDHTPRRDFLRISGASLAGAALHSRPAEAQTPPPAPNAGIFDVKFFGATGDGKTIDTPAINRAIEAAASAGGGTVRFPSGNYLCYSIRLKSNVALSLDQNAVIIAAQPANEPATDPSDSTSGSGTYDLAEPNTSWDAYQDYGHNHWRNSLLWGEGLENISITGPGLLWGRGLSRGWGPGPVAEHAGVANKTISLKNCRNITLRDFSILKGGHFGILATGVDNFTIDNLKIDTDRDGIDIDCCRNVRVSNCSVNSPWDDAICPKSSFALGYARATENVTITNCYVTGIYKLGTLLDGTFQRFDASDKHHGTGRIKFGTESNGGFKNITVSNCVFEGCQGLALETVDGALLEDIAITNITMRDITSAPIFLRLGSRMRGPAGVPVGSLRRVLISNVVCSNAASSLGSILSGIPGHPIEDIQLNDIYIQHRGGGAPEAAAIHPPELENKYPEPDMFGAMPSHGFFLRHVKNISVSNVEISSLKEDARPAFVLEDVQSADFFRIRTPRAANVPTFALTNVTDFTVSRSKHVADTQLDHADQKKL